MEQPDYGFPIADLRWSFCDRHNIWHYTDHCPACAAVWPENVVGEPCTECAWCFHRHGDLEADPPQFCPHRCDPPICHPGQECERTPE